MLEYWFVKGFNPFLNFLAKMGFDINPFYHYPITQYSIIPAFQYSNEGESPKHD